MTESEISSEGSPTPSPSESDPVPDPTAGPSVAPDDLGEPLVVLSDVDKHFGELHVLQKINLTVRKGEVVVVPGTVRLRASRPCAGPSTGWKRSSPGPSPSTVSNCPKKARHWLICAPMSGWCSSRSTSSAHKTVLENVTLGPIKVRKKSAAEAKKRGMELLSASGSSRRPKSIRLSCPAASSSAWQSPGRSPWIPR